MYMAKLQNSVINLLAESVTATPNCNSRFSREIDSETESLYLEDFLFFRGAERAFQSFSKCKILSKNRPMPKTAHTSLSRA